MDLLNNLALGFQTALSLQNLLYCFGGVVLGTIIGVLPGLGPVPTIAMLMPVTYALQPVSALIMLAGIYYGAQYGGRSATSSFRANCRTSVSCRRVEFWFGVLACVGVLLIDVLQGMIIGLVASLIFVIYRSSRPHLSSLGRVPGVPGAYSDLGRHPENTPIPGVLILRLDGPLYYASALTFRVRVKAMVNETEPLPRALIFDAGNQDRIDLTSTEMLKGLIKELRAKGIAVYFAGVHAPVRELSSQLVEQRLPKVDKRDVILDILRPQQ